jgi:hypothetical protein
VVVLTLETLNKAFSLVAGGVLMCTLVHIGFDIVGAHEYIHASSSLIGDYGSWMFGGDEPGTLASYFSAEALNGACSHGHGAVGGHEAVQMAEASTPEVVSEPVQEEIVSDAPSCAQDTCPHETHAEPKANNHSQYKNRFVTNATKAMSLKKASEVCRFRRFC